METKLCCGSVDAHQIMARMLMRLDKHVCRKIILVDEGVNLNKQKTFSMYSNKIAQFSLPTYINNIFI